MEDPRQVAEFYFAFADQWLLMLIIAAVFVTTIYLLLFPKNRVRIPFNERGALYILGIYTDLELGPGPWLVFWPLTRLRRVVVKDWPLPYEDEVPAKDLVRLGIELTAFMMYTSVREVYEAVADQDPAEEIGDVLDGIVEETIQEHLHDYWFEQGRRTELAQTIRRKLNQSEILKKWKVKCNSVNVTELNVPEEISRAQERVAIAEAWAQEEVVRASGEAKAQIERARGEKEAMKTIGPLAWLADRAADAFEAGTKSGGLRTLVFPGTGGADSGFKDMIAAALVANASEEEEEDG
jgi:regulator of protease activity HflC (stomatin/prohibitin superfamily)